MFYNFNRNRVAEQRGYLNSSDKNCSGGAGTIVVKYPTPAAAAENSSNNINNWLVTDDSRWIYKRLTSMGMAVIACGKNDAIQKSQRNFPQYAVLSASYGIVPQINNTNYYWLCTLVPRPTNSYGGKSRRRKVKGGKTRRSKGRKTRRR
jgi:hypothetical protein